MKKLAIHCMSISLTFVLLMSSCRNKEDATDSTPAVSDSEMSISTTHATDNQDATANIDDALNNINTDLSGGVAAGRLENTEACGFTADYSKFSTVSGSNQKTIVYTFDKQSICSERSRQGKITVTLVSGNYFREKDAVYTLDFEGYGVTYNGKTMTLTGMQTITNVTGGLPASVIFFPTLFPSVTHKVTGEMELSFDTSSGQRTWNINREITWANTNGVLSYTIKSDLNQGGLSNVSAWGTNRFGNSFYTQILSPIIANTNCGWYRPTGGELLHTLKDSDGTTLFTIDAKLNVNGAGCGNGYTITTTNKKGKVRQKTISY